MRDWLGDINRLTKQVEEVKSLVPYAKSLVPYAKCWEALVKRKLVTKKTGRRPPGKELKQWQEDVKAVFKEFGLDGIL